MTTRTSWARWSAPLVPATGLIAVLVLWAIGWQTEVLPRSSVPSPAATWDALWEQLGDAEFWERLGQTMLSWFVGLCVSVLIAIPLGLIVGASGIAFRLTRIVIDALRPIPPIVVVPLAILTLGTSLKFKSVLIAQGAVWPLFIQTAYGVRSTDPVALDTATSFRLGAARRMFQVRLPSAAGQIATGLRLSAAVAFAVCMMTEIVGGAKGIGSIMLRRQIGDDIASVFALTIVAGIIGLMIAAVFGVVERRLLRFAPRGQ